MPFAASGTAQLSYVVAGAGPAVLLVHAGVTDKRSWTPLVESLGGRYRTIAYDQRGFGETTYEPEPHSAVADALAVLDAEGVDQAIVIGASNGGRRSIHLALDHPERVRALVLIAAGARGGPDDDVDAFTDDVRALYRAYEAAEEAGDLDELNRHRGPRLARRLGGAGGAGAGAGPRPVPRHEPHRPARGRSRRRRHRARHGTSSTRSPSRPWSSSATSTSSSGPRATTSPRRSRVPASRCCAAPATCLTSRVTRDAFGR